MAKIDVCPLEFPAPGGPLRFAMKRQAETFCDLEVDHWRIPVSKPQRQTKADGAASAPNATRMICDASRALFLDRYADRATPRDWADEAEVHLLARLSPEIRIRGAGSLFAEALESRKRRFESLADTELERMLMSAAPRPPLSEKALTERLIANQKRTEFTAEEQSLYTKFILELFGVAVGLWKDHPEEAFARVRALWLEWERRFSGRKKQETALTVLDAISYEALTCFRRCFSNVVSEWILPRLVREYGLSAHSILFHQFWYCQVVRPSQEDPERNFHAFDGQILGLHPAGSRLLNTEQGRLHIGEFLKAAVHPVPLPERAQAIWNDAIPKLPEYRRLLSAYELAHYQYRQRRDDANETLKETKRIGVRRASMKKSLASKSTYTRK